jgi:thiol-disulfide isomerase/thioredoxin
VALSSSLWRNVAIAIAAIALSTGLFFALQGRNHQVSLAAVAERAVPLEVAQTNGKPTLIEFYADWCSSCRAMAPAIASLEEEYDREVNFVLLNVDNTKWLPELTQYRVNGIPHFEFLTADGTSLGRTVGEQPRVVMAANLAALGNGSLSLESTSVTGRTSEFTAPAAAQTQPRSHG